MRHKTFAPEPVLRAYLAVLRDAILSIRMRIRYGETIDMQEIHDLMDAVENIPEMLCAYGDWHVEGNIDWGLKHYDERWYKQGADPPMTSLQTSLEKAKREVDALRQDECESDE